MSPSAALLQFAAEFVLFLAASGGIASALAARQPGGRRPLARAAVALGFGALAASAVLRGSDLADEADTALVVGLRGTAVALLAVESLWAPLSRAARAALWAGLLLLIAAGAADVAGEATATAAALTVAAAALGLSAILASPRSVAARVSTGAAVTLLALVLVLGVALSAVLLDTVQDSVVERLERRAGNEAALAAAAATQLAGPARVVGGSLSGGPLRDTVQRLADRQSASATLNEPLATLSANFLDDAPLAYLSRRGAVQGAVNLGGPEVVGISGAQVVSEALEAGQARNAVEVVAGSALALRVQPVPIEGGPPVLGVAVAAAPLDRTYLERVARDDPDLALALATADATLASFGPAVAPGAVEAALAEALATGAIVSTTTDGRYVAVAPVDRGDGVASAALVASYPASLVAGTRDELFRILFLIALAGTLLALGLASVVGARIGARLRVLTEAAGALRRGEAVPRTAVAGDDEVAVLASTFDAMARSVADKTAAEAALRGRLEAVVAGMGEALVAFDGDGAVTEFNPAAEALLGRSSAEAAGQPVDEVLRLRDAGGRPLAAELREPGRWDRATVDAGPGGPVPVAVSVGALAGPGGRGAVVILRDRRGEEQLARMKEQVLSRYSHELRHPLTVILGYAPKLAGGRARPEQVRDWGSAIAAEGQALLRIVEILEFFVERASGREPLAREHLQPGELVDEAVRRWRPGLAPGMSLGRRVGRRLPPLYADRLLVGRCLNELVDNARKFSPDGGRIVLGAERAGDAAVALTVTDAGIGMTAEEQAEAFKPFEQADASDTRRFGGLGLGLPFVLEVAQAHGGEVRCESSPGSGTKFSLVLPALPREAER